jgi:hypothetical protein
LNFLFGIEVCNAYDISDSCGRNISLVLEAQGTADSSAFMRQLLRDQRPFVAYLTDNHGSVMFRFHRPFCSTVSSIFIYDANDVEIGVVDQRWHLWKRQYDFYHRGRHVGSVDSPFFSWVFEVIAPGGLHVATIHRTWRSLVRELFTDSGTYVCHFGDSGSKSIRDEMEFRAVTLAAAVQIDFNHFSHISSTGGWLNTYVLRRLFSSWDRS